MGGTTSVLYSGAVEAAAGMAVSSVVSSITSSNEMHERLDVILFRLQQQVIKIQCAISAAKARQIRDPKLLEWLASLINAAYHGKFYHRTFQRRISCPPMIESEDTSNLFIFTFHRLYKRRRTMRSLTFGNDELKKLHDVVEMLTSIDIRAFLDMVSAHPERPIKTYIYMDQNKLVNRDKETEYVVKFLLEPSRTGTNNVDILPIIGVSGVGKTSLVLHCFNKSKVQNHFSMKIYISGSTIDYSVCTRSISTIFQQILMQCHSPSDIISADGYVLYLMLKKKLSSERFFLVIDEVCHIDSAVWNVLLGCLRSGKEGSKIIFTSDTFFYTKCHDIAKAGTVKPLMLAPFSEEEYKQFFMEHAFGSADPEEYPDLIQIGREIEKKMNGSIYGAKILGELLRDNLNFSFWSMFLQDGFSASGFLHNMNLLSVCDVISELLPGRTVYSLRVSYGTKGDQHPSFRELMVLDPTYSTPVIKYGKDFVKFSVTEYFNLYEYVVVTAFCAPTCNESKILLGET